jgi:hypothetical protein
MHRVEILLKSGPMVGWLATGGRSPLLCRLEIDWMHSGSYISNTGRSDVEGYKTRGK